MFYTENQLPSVPVFYGTFFYLWETPTYFFCMVFLIFFQLFCHIAFDMGKKMVFFMMKEMKSILKRRRKSRHQLETIENLQMLASKNQQE